MNSLSYVMQKYELMCSDDVSTFELSVPRTDLAQLFYELGYKTGAEIGVECGLFSEELLKANSDLRLYCIDPWKIETHQHASFITMTQDTMDAFYMLTVKRLIPYDCKIIRKNSMDAVRGFKPNSLDFIYIDGNHSFDYVMSDIIAWSKVVKPGGIVSGHDYRPDEIVGIDFHVMYAVDAYRTAHKIAPLFIVRDDGTPSWFWVKP